MQTGFNQGKSEIQSVVILFKKIPIQNIVNAYAHKFTSVRNCGLRS